MQGKRAAHVAQVLNQREGHEAAHTMTEHYQGHIVQFMRGAGDGIYMVRQTIGDRL